MAQNNEASRINEFYRDRSDRQDEQQVSLFKAGAAGLVSAGLARWLFGNRGS